MVHRDHGPRVCSRNHTRAAHHNLTQRTGAVTDYGSTTVQWMRNRKPRYKNALYSEVERPSASYIVDVCPSTLVPRAWL